jgi:flagellar protein FliO/FliZ
MTQTLLLVVLFVAAIALLPWLVRRVQLRQGRFAPSSAAAPRVLSAIAVGPQQRVVTVEVGAEGERTTLVLGVTAQSIRCLHTLRSQGDASPTPDSFSRAMAKASESESFVPQPSDEEMRKDLERAAR